LCRPYSTLMRSGVPAARRSARSNSAATTLKHCGGRAARFVGGLGARSGVGGALRGNPPAGAPTGVGVVSPARQAPEASSSMSGRQSRGTTAGGARRITARPLRVGRWRCRRDRAPPPRGPTTLWSSTAMRASSSTVLALAFLQQRSRQPLASQAGERNGSRPAPPGRETAAPPAAHAAAPAGRRPGPRRATSPHLNSASRSQTVPILAAARAAARRRRALRSAGTRAAAAAAADARAPLLGGKWGRCFCLSIQPCCGRGVHRSPCRRSSRCSITIRANLI
jgi:hypothetical protein